MIKTPDARRLRRYAVLGLALIASAGIAIVATYSAGGTKRPLVSRPTGGLAQDGTQSPKVKGRDHRMPKAKSGPLDDSATVSYPAVEMTVSPPSGAVPTGETTASVLASFVEQQVPANALDTVLGSESPTVTFASITELAPSSPAVTAGVPFDGWVVTYATSPAVSYGSSSIPSDDVCSFVGVQDAGNSEWTNFFQTCSPPS